MNKKAQYLLGKQLRSIYHIGGIAITAIWVKPIVDILIETVGKCALTRVAAILKKHGHLQMSASTTRISLNKGYTEQRFAERVFHFHLRFPGDNDEIHFRDYLQTHPDVAKEYEALKQALLPHFQHDRDGYTRSPKNQTDNLLNEDLYSIDCLSGFLGTPLYTAGKS